jgi:hypothetical protein
VTRWFLAFDAATMVLATAWVTGLVERRAHGRFRVSDLDLAPVGNAGWVLLVGYGVFAVVVGLLFLVETARMWAWARAADDAHDPSLRGR